MTNSFFTSKGVPVAVGRELGTGGEGAVFEVLGSEKQVAKLYHAAPDAKKQTKLRFMASTVDTQLLNYVAWPQETLHASRGGPVVGFLMPKVAGKAPIHMIYSPAHRKQDYPTVAWDFLLCVARNIAASFETVHAHGHVIGDVNQNSFLVGSDSKVVLIDSDSFQVNSRGILHLCEVGVSHFTPPELQSLSSFDGFTRTANHDNFGLALLIFHVLFGGRHPFSGVPLRNDVGTALETDIKNFRYAYARDSRLRGLNPPPRSIPVSILPDVMESMFHFAFTERGSSVARPIAQQWVTALDQLRSRLKRCGTSSIHIYPSHLAACPWCTLDNTGVVYFVDLGATITPTSSGFVLTQVWGLIQAVPTPPPVNAPNPNSFTLTARPLPTGIPGKGAITCYKLVAVAIAIAICIAVPGAWFLALLAGGGGWAMAGSAGATERATEARKRLKSLELARQEYVRLVERLKKETGPEGFNARKDSFVRIRAELEGLTRAEQAELDKLHSTAHERQKQKFLETCFLDRANIPGVGPNRKATLRSFGIETAADVTRRRVRQVRGFGVSLTRAVLDWQASCERRFRFNPAAAVSDSDRNAVRTKYVTKRRALEQSLASAPTQLRQFRKNADEQLATLQPKLNVAAKQLAQAQADYSLLE